MTPEERKGLREKWTRCVNDNREEILGLLDALDEAEKLSLGLADHLGREQANLLMANERIAELEAAFSKANGLLEDFRSDISRDDLSDEAYESWCQASKFVQDQGGTQ